MENKLTPEYIKEKMAAFKLLGRASKALTKTDHNTEETVHGIFRAMSYILKELLPVMDQIKKDNPDFIDIIDHLLRVF